MHSSDPPIAKSGAHNWNEEYMGTREGGSGSGLDDAGVPMWNSTNGICQLTMTKTMRKQKTPPHDELQKSPIPADDKLFGATHFST